MPAVAAPAATYRFFDHTGDFGVDVEAPTPAALVAGVARALLALLTDDPDRVEPREARPLEVRGLDGPATLVALGNELLYRFEVERFLVARLDPRVVTLGARGGHIAGVAHGEPFDPARHPIARPMKAVTHHGAALTLDRGRCAARLIVDL